MDYWTYDDVFSIWNLATIILTICGFFIIAIMAGKIAQKKHIAAIVLIIFYTIVNILLCLMSTQNSEFSPLISLLCICLVGINLIFPWCVIPFFLIVATSGDKSWRELSVFYILIIIFYNICWLLHTFFAMAG